MTASTILRPNPALRTGTRVHHCDPEQVAAGFCGLYLCHVGPAHEQMKVWLLDGSVAEVPTDLWVSGTWEATR